MTHNCKELYLEHLVLIELVSNGNPPRIKQLTVSKDASDDEQSGKIRRIQSKTFIKCIGLKRIRK